MTGTPHPADVAVFENETSGVSGLSNYNTHHCPRQVVGANDVVGEKHPKHGVNRAEQPVAEIRLLPRLHGIDVGGPEDVKTGEPSPKQLLFGLSLIACKAIRLCSVWSPAPGFRNAS